MRILGGRIMVDIRNIAGEIPGNFAQGLGDVLSRHLDAESGAKGDDWQIDTFTNDFEDEFPFDPEAPGSPYPTYGPEANRAADGKPYGDDRNNRPKVHELNQPQLAQSRGWRIIDLYPERNKKSEFYRISGTPAEIRLLTQQIRHIREVIKSSVGDFNFEEWFKEWEKGFPSFVNRFHASNSEIKTNFPLVDYAGANGQTIEAWRKDLSTRPTFIKWEEAKQDKKYLVIEYFPDRSQPKSILLTGSEGQIINHIIQYHYEGGGTGGGTESDYAPETLSFVGLPKVVLYFKELSSDVEPGYRPLYSQIGFRIVDKTDNPDSNLPKISKSDIKALATKIRDIFATKPVPYRIHRGKETVSVKDKNRGFDGYIYVYSKNDGIELFTKLYEVQDLTIDLKKVFHKVTLDEVGAYPTVAPNITVLGKSIKPTRIRPVGYVQFFEARLFLSRLANPIKLCDSLGYLYRDSE